MVCAPVRSIIPSLKLGDYFSVQAHKPCSISHLSLTKSNAELVFAIFFQQLARLCYNYLNYKNLFLLLFTFHDNNNLF